MLMSTRFSNVDYPKANQDGQTQHEKKYSDVLKDSFCHISIIITNEDEVNIKNLLQLSEKLLFS